MLRFIAGMLLATGCTVEADVAVDTGDAAEWAVDIGEPLPPPPATLLGLVISANGASTSALVYGAPGGAKVIAIVGEPGVGPCPAALGLCLDIASPEVAGSAIADVAGTAQIILPKVLSGDLVQVVTRTAAGTLASSAEVVP